MNHSAKEPANTAAHQGGSHSNEEERANKKRPPTEKNSEKAQREQDRQLESGEENPA